MFRSAKWKSEKNRINVVFKLQFHATQVSETGSDELVLSVVSPENAKPTVKLEKCRMVDNGCYWENPVYETVKFVQDPKNGKIQERVYHFIVSTGVSKGSVVYGDFSVNIADFVGATKACLVSFPLQSSYLNAHFYVSIQRIPENINQRDLEENEDLKVKTEDKSLRRYFSNWDIEEEATAISVEDTTLRKTVSHMGLNGISRGSSGWDVTSSTSDSSSGLNTPRQTGVRISNVSKNQMSNFQDQHRTRWESALLPANDSITDYSMNRPRDESSEKLRADFVSLSRRAEISDLELQTLRKQIMKENKRSQDLMRELTSLKQERDSLKDECGKLKGSRKSRLHFEGDPSIYLEEMKEELNYEKSTNANLRLQLQKTQESNAELMLAVQDLEEILEKKNKGVYDLPNRSSCGESTLEIEESILHGETSCSDDEEQKALEAIVRQHSDANEAYLLEQKIMDLCSEVEMYRRDKDDLQMQMEQLALDYEILKQENHEFSSRLKQTHLQEQLNSQYDCSSSYSAVSEFEAKNEKLQNEIKKLEAGNQGLEEELEKQAHDFKTDKDEISRAHTEALSTVNELRTEKEKLNKELKKLFREFSGSLATIQELETRNTNQTEGYGSNIEALFHAKLEQEQRAIQAEEALSRSNATISELKSDIEKLENEAKKHSRESSDTFTTIKELEAHIKNLTEELAKQAEGFQADIEAVSHAKVEEEQKAIRAEEALKLMRWKNTNAAARIQDEFKTLSSQVQSSFEANEKISRKAFSEATELRLQNHYLQDMLQKANAELESSKDDYETKLREICNQMAGEIEEKSKQLENQKKSAEESQKSVSEELLMLRAEIERLNDANRSLSAQAKEAEKLKTLIEKRHREVAGKPVEDLQSEMEALKVQCEKLKKSLYEGELEKEKLRKQMFQLKSDLKKKDEAISSLEKKFKDKSRATLKSTNKCESVQRVSSKLGGPKEVVTLKERVKSLKQQIKSKDTAVETSANAFLLKETNLNGKIEELESRLRELNEEKVSTQVDRSEEDSSTLAEETSSSSENLKDSSGKPYFDTQPSTPKDIYGEHKFDTLLKEMVSMKERNKSMETELNEMQDRYSEISLKFAEVEGERQQLVMNLRNLKNANNT